MIAYPIGKNLYLNITNRCPNKCSFCIRDTKEGVGYDLWLDKEPGLNEILESIVKPEQYDEIVFCGYGEPLTRINTILEVAKNLKKKDIRIRINTNGQANLIHGRNIAPELAGLVDAISISLNAENGLKYQQICHSQFGEEAFAGILEFARECKKYIPKVVLSVVDIPDIDLEKCSEIAKTIGVELKIRTLND